MSEKISCDVCNIGMELNKEGDPVLELKFTLLDNHPIGDIVDFLVYLKGQGAAVQLTNDDQLKTTQLTFSAQDGE